MYDKEFSFTGKHVSMVESLTKFPYKATEGLTSNRFVFKSNIDLFLIAPLVGVLYNRKSAKDPSSLSTKIFSEQFKPRYDDIEFLIRLVILTYQDDHLTDNDKINLAFKGYYETEKREYVKNTFESFLLGGIEYLYEMIIKDTKSIDEVTQRFEEFNDIFQASFM